MNFNSINKGWGQWSWANPSFKTDSAMQLWLLPLGVSWLDEYEDMVIFITENYTVPLTNGDKKQYKRFQIWVLRFWARLMRKTYEASHHLYSSAANLYVFRRSWDREEEIEFLLTLNPD
jgi:hypothetical protein